MHQIYRRTPMPKCIEITLWQWCSAVNLLHIFRTPFPKNTSRWLLLSLLLFLDLDHSIIAQIFFCISFLICFAKYKLPLSRIMSETNISVQLNNIMLRTLDNMFLQNSVISVCELIICHLQSEIVALTNRKEYEI